ncbi:UNVERIFIED_CONTAM: hypothetical protein RMT77_019749 [Armadillidium vulgare]
MKKNYVPLYLSTDPREFNNSIFLQHVRERRCMYVVPMTKAVYYQIQFNLTLTNSYLVDDKVYGFQMRFLLAKHSTLIDPINISLRRILESGIYDFLLKKYQMTNRTYFEASIYSTDFIAIRLVDIQTAFYALLGGCALSILTFLAEILMKKKKKRII